MRYCLKIPGNHKIINFYQVPAEWPRYVRRRGTGGSLLKKPKPGITALIALGILEYLQEQEIIKPLLEMEHNSPEYLHVLVEVMRFVFIAPE